MTQIVGVQTKILMRSFQMTDLSTANHAASIDLWSSRPSPDQMLDLAPEPSANR